MAPGNFTGYIKIYIKGDVLFATDTYNNRIEKYENNTWYMLNSPTQEWITYIIDTSVGEAGDGRFDLAAGINVDQNGYIYAADTSNSRIQIFLPDAVFLGWLGTASGYGDGWFIPGTADAYAGTFIDSPVSVVMDNKHSKLYICCNPNRIMVFDRIISGL